MHAEAFTTATVLLFCALVAAVPLLAIVNAWFVEQEISAATGFALLCGLLALVGGVFATWGSPLSFGLMGAIAALYFLIPGMAAHGQRSLKRRMLEEDVERYQAAIAQDPRNAAAHSALGDVYYRHGMYPQAIEELRIAVELDPKFSKSEAYKLRMAEQLLAKTPPAIRICPNCRAENPREFYRCASCYQLMGVGFLQWVREPANFRSITRSAVMVLIPLTLAIAVLRLLNPFMVPVLILGGLAGGAFYLYRKIV